VVTAHIIAAMNDNFHVLEIHRPYWLTFFTKRDQ